MRAMRVGGSDWSKQSVQAVNEQLCSSSLRSAAETPEHHPADSAGNGHPDSDLLGSSSIALLIFLRGLRPGMIVEVNHYVRSYESQKSRSHASESIITDV
jgi:hypothetical protein